MRSVAELCDYETLTNDAAEQRSQHGLRTQEPWLIAAPAILDRTASCYAVLILRNRSAVQSDAEASFAHWQLLPIFYHHACTVRVSPSGSPNASLATRLTYASALVRLSTVL